MTILTHLGNASDRQIESILFDLIGDETFNNFQIAPAATTKEPR